MVVLELDAQLKDRNGVDLIITYDLLEIEKRILDCLLEALLDLRVDLLDVAEPHLLDFQPIKDEGFIGLAQDALDVIEGGLQFRVHVTAVLLLLGLEHLVIVRLLAIDVDEYTLRDLIALQFDSLRIGLEHLQLNEELVAGSPALSHESVEDVLGAPSQTSLPR